MHRLPPPLLSSHSAPSPVLEDVVRQRRQLRPPLVREHEDTDVRLPPNCSTTSRRRALCRGSRCSRRRRRRRRRDVGAQRAEACSERLAAVVDLLQGFVCARRRWCEGEPLRCFAVLGTSHTPQECFKFSRHALVTPSPSYLPFKHSAPLHTLTSSTIRMRCPDNCTSPGASPYRSHCVTRTGVSAVTAAAAAAPPRRPPLASATSSQSSS